MAARCSVIAHRRRKSLKRASSSSRAVRAPRAQQRQRPGVIQPMRRRPLQHQLQRPGSQPAPPRTRNLRRKRPRPKQRRPRRPRPNRTELRRHRQKTAPALVRPKPLMTAAASSPRAMLRASGCSWTRQHAMPKPSALTASSLPTASADPARRLWCRGDSISRELRLAQ
jgi:hypothetical protein